MSSAIKLGCSKIDILYLISNLTIGGHQGYLVDQIARLSKGQFTAHVAYLNEGPFRIYLEAQTVKTFAYGRPFQGKALQFLPNYLQAIIHVARYMRHENIDLVVTGDPISYIVGTLAAKIVARATVRIPGILMKSSERLLSKWFRWLPFGYLTDMFICGMKCMLEEYRNLGVPEKKLRLFSHGVDIYRYHPGLTGDDFRHEIRLQNDVPIVGIVSRIEANRGIDTLILSLPLVLPRFPNMKCIVVGDGSRLTEYRQLSAEIRVEKSVIFTGARTDTTKTLPAFDVAAFPIVNNAGGQFMREAMACGIPVITTLTLGGVQREYIEEGVSGLLIPEKDPNALAEAICRLLADPCCAKEMGRAARQVAEKKCNIYTSHAATEELYLELARTNNLLSRA